jgi:hypothetical protein
LDQHLERIRPEEIPECQWRKLDSAVAGALTKHQNILRGVGPKYAARKWIAYVKIKRPLQGRDLLDAVERWVDTSTFIIKVDIS